MPEPKTPAEYRRAFALYLAEIDRLRESMAQDQIEIERSQARTWAALAEIKAILGKSDDAQRDRENQAHEHDKLLLRLEVTLLRAERRTLTGNPDKPLLTPVDWFPTLRKIWKV